MTALLLATVLLGDVTVAVETEIVSERPIAAIVLEGMVGYVARPKADARHEGMEKVCEVAQAAVSAMLRDGPIVVASRVWKVVGFVLWDRSGTVKYAYSFRVRPGANGQRGGLLVERSATISNGRVLTSVRLTGDLGEKRLRSVTLTVEANEGDPNRRGDRKNATVIRATLSANVSCGCFGRHLVRRIATRELSAELLDLVGNGRRAVRDGSIERIIEDFLQARARHPAKVPPRAFSHRG